MGFYNYLLSNQLLDQSQVSVKRLDRADNIYLSIFKKKNEVKAYLVHLPESESEGFSSESSSQGRCILQVDVMVISPSSRVFELLQYECKLTERPLLSSSWGQEPSGKSCTERVATLYSISCHPACQCIPITLSGLRRRKN